MGFLSRSLSGLVLAGLTVGLVALAVANIFNASAERSAMEGRRPAPAERLYAVNTGLLQPEEVRPVLTAYGDLQSAHKLELRAATGGTLTALATGFRDGGRVEAGEILFEIDPADAQASLALAENDLASAQAAAREAAVGLELAREELSAAERQLALRSQALERSKDLRGRGVSTASDLEAAELALAAAEQALSGRRLARAQAEARIDSTAIATRRAEIALSEAERNLENTREVAPFSGILADVDTMTGRLVSTNERLGVLLDPLTLEVGFRVSNAEFARLTGSQGELLPLGVVAELDAGGIGVPVSGVIDRAGASVGSGQTGRLIYAHLDVTRTGILRPGDFLTVRVSEPEMRDVAVVPATAVGGGAALLLVGEDDRLEEAEVSILRRQGDSVILGDVPFGRSYVTEWLPELGSGVRVRPVTPAGSDRSQPEEDQMVTLTPERRQELLAALEANGRMPDDAKARLRAALEASEVPKRMVDRLEAGAARSGG